MPSRKSFRPRPTRHRAGESHRVRQMSGFDGLPLPGRGLVVLTVAPPPERILLARSPYHRDRFRVSRVGRVWASGPAAARGWTRPMMAATYSAICSLSEQRAVRPASAPTARGPVTTGPRSSVRAGRRRSGRGVRLLRLLRHVRRVRRRREIDRPAASLFRSFGSSMDGAGGRCCASVRLDRSRSSAVVYEGAALALRALASDVVAARASS